MEFSCFYFPRPRTAMETFILAYIISAITTVQNQTLSSFYRQLKNPVLYLDILFKKKSRILRPTVYPLL